MKGLLETTEVTTYLEDNGILFDPTRLVSVTEISTTGYVTASEIQIYSEITDADLALLIDSVELSQGLVTSTAAKHATTDVVGKAVSSLITNQNARLGLLRVDLDTSENVIVDRYTGIATTAPDITYEIWGILNGGVGATIIGNWATSFDETGVTQVITVLSNGASDAFLSTANYPIATVTGSDPYTMRRLYTSTDLSATTTEFASVVSANIASDPLWAGGQSEAVVQAEYNGFSLGGG